MTRDHMRYSAIVGDATGRKRQRAWSVEEPYILDGTIKGFKCILVQKFGEHCNADLYTGKDHLIDSVVKDVQRFRSLTILDSSS